MPRYRIEVIEVSHVQCVYAVVADDPEKATRAVTADFVVGRVGSNYVCVDGQSSGGDGVVESVSRSEDDITIVKRVAQGEPKQVGKHPYAVGTYATLKKAAASDDDQSTMRVVRAGTDVDIKAVAYYPAQGYTYRVEAQLDDGTTLLLVYTEDEADAEWDVYKTP